MSQHTVQAVIGKAITDTLFRQSMFADPAATLASYELTPEEMDGLRGSTSRQWSVARVLDDRIARGRWCDKSLAGSHGGQQPAQ
ncbi:MAG: Franean1_4349 family RiPP [Caldilineales bacterium]